MTGLPARRIAHLSDLHFGAERPALVASLTADVRAMAPDLVCVSGDLTLRAQARQFQAARTFLDGLGCPFVAVPGNHDLPRFELWQRFTDPYGRWHRFLGIPRQTVWSDQALVVCGLDSTRRARWHLDWSAGGISDRQRSWLAQAGANRGSRPMLVVLHHPPEHPKEASGRRALEDGAELRQTLHALGAGAILVGHLHRPVRLGDTTPELHAGSALSWRDGGDGNSYNVIDIVDGALRATVRRHGPTGWRWAEPLLGSPIAAPELTSTLAGQG
jgi:3',5'-cyclic AMP phosphodiesterase CpdA